MSNDKLHLRVLQVNDVYVLEQFPSLSTIFEQYKQGADLTLIFLAGDFVSPSLLSSLDHGQGMVDLMNHVGFTHVCLGNHEADIDTDELKKRIDQSKFTWINSNMRELDDKIGVKTDAYDIVTVSNGTQSKKICLMGLMTDDKDLYRVGRFGDATIVPVMDAFQSTLDTVKKEHPDVSFILPQTHQYVVEDRTFLQKYGDATNMPLVIGGHEHTVIDETVNGTRVFKSGIDAENVAVHDITWDMSAGASAAPTHNLTLLETKTFAKDPATQKLVDAHETILNEFDKAKLFKISDWDDNADSHLDPSDDGYVPFTTKDNRCQPTTGSMVICGIVRMGMRAHGCIFNSGSIRGNKLYPRDQKWFTWSDLQSEIAFSSEMTALLVPGQVIEDSIAFSRKPALDENILDNGGYLQTCDMIDFDDTTRKIKTIMGKPFNPKMPYIIAIPIVTLQGMDNIEPLVDWYNKTHKKPIDTEMGRPAKYVMVEFFSAQLWLTMGNFGQLDSDKDGYLTESELRTRIQEMYGYELTNIVADNIMSVADLDGDGKISTEEMLVTQYVATDMMKHVSKKDENTTMTRLACDLLQLPAKDPRVKAAVAKMKNIIDTSDNGRLSRKELIGSLGDLESKDIL